MKIKEFLKELAYVTTYSDYQHIIIGSYDVEMFFKGGDIAEVYLEDLDGKKYLIARIYSECDGRTDKFSPWCENELLRGCVNEKFDRKEIPTND